MSQNLLIANSTASSDLCLDEAWILAKEALDQDAKTSSPVPPLASQYQAFNTVAVLIYPSLIAIITALPILR